MARNYTKREIANLLSCSAETINTDCEWFKFVPEKGDRGTNLYSEKQFQLITQMRDHCNNGRNTRDSFVAKAITEVVEPEENLIVTRMVQELKLPLVESLSTNLNESLKLDPFYNLELLERVVKNGWTLPTNIIAILIDIKPKSFTRRNSFNFCGFRITKIKDEDSLGRGYNWMVTK